MARCARFISETASSDRPWRRRVGRCGRKAADRRGGSIREGRCLWVRTFEPFVSWAGSAAGLQSHAERCESVGFAVGSWFVHQNSPSVRSPASGVWPRCSKISSLLCALADWALGRLRHVPLSRPSLYDTGWTSQPPQPSQTALSGLVGDRADLRRTMA